MPKIIPSLRLLQLKLSPHLLRVNVMQTFSFTPNEQIFWNRIHFSGNILYLLINNTLPEATDAYLLIYQG